MAAAEKVDDPQLANAFREQAIQRKKFAYDLEAESRFYGVDTGDIKHEGTFSGDIHRSWMDLKTALSSNEEEAVIEECIRGEQVALQDYNELIKEANFTAKPQSLIRRQRNTVKDCIVNCNA